MMHFVGPGLGLLSRAHFDGDQTSSLARQAEKWMGQLPEWRIDNARPVPRSVGALQCAVGLQSMARDLDGGAGMVTQRGLSRTGHLHARVNVARVGRDRV